MKKKTSEWKKRQRRKLYEKALNVCHHNIPKVFSRMLLPVTMKRARAIIGLEVSYRNERAKQRKD